VTVEPIDWKLVVACTLAGASLAISSLLVLVALLEGLPRLRLHIHRRRRRRHLDDADECKGR
jgi:hypothetical protein